MDVYAVLRTLKIFGEEELLNDILKVLSKSAFKPLEHALLTEMFFNQNDMQACIFHGNKALEELPEEQKSSINFILYQAYKIENDFEKALEILSSVNDSSAVNAILFEKANCLYDNNQKEESYQVLKSIDRKDLNNFEQIKYDACISHHLLRNGNFKDGLKHVIMSKDEVQRLERNGRYHNRTELPLEFWEGTPDCKNLIVYLEAGLGDEIINIRFLNNLKDMGINPKLYNVFYENAEKEGRKGLPEFYEKNGFSIITKFDPEKYADYKWTYSQYLPILLSLNEKDLWTGPYLKAGKKRLKGKKKIGLRWAGNPNPRYRNFKLAEIYEALKDLDVTFYSIQKNECMDELANYPEIVDLSGELDSLSDMADYINSFDLTITCPTVSSTIAGALNKKCIVLTPCSDYYIFNTKNDKTPWFGKNMTLLRQKTPKIWSDVATELKQLVVKTLGLKSE